ncbi:MAG: chloride channel protein [Myxococcaceae bacterium]|nr:chloride channel protein [Myxococcaceae bacterium]
MPEAAPHPPSFVERGAVWLLGGAAVGLASGLASALFLFGLERVTRTRETTVLWLPWLLPLAGLALGWVKQRSGAPAARGTALVLEAAGDGAPVPARLGLFALLGTWWTHLFGGSAGREGAAVQLGGVLADALALRSPRLRAHRSDLVLCGIAAGFGSVFGTPLAGALFALEVVAPGRLVWTRAPACLWAAVVADAVARAVGTTHSVYPRVEPVDLSPHALLGWLALALAVALTVRAFLFAAHGVSALLERTVRLPMLRPFVGGGAVVALWLLAQSSDYFGLGVPGILRAASTAEVPPFAFAWKLAFTACTVGSGFLGGEVTPLFFIGAHLGHTLAGPLGLPVVAASVVALAALFGAAARSPLALAVMAFELSGPEVLPYALAVGLIATWLCGRQRLYQGQLP